MRKNLRCLGWLGDVRGIPLLLELVQTHAGATVPALNRLDPEWTTTPPGIEIIGAQLAMLKTLSANSLQIANNDLDHTLTALGSSVHAQLLAILRDPDTTPTGQVLAARLLLNCRNPEREATARSSLINIVKDGNLDQAVRFAALTLLDDSMYNKDEDVNLAILALARDLIAVSHPPHDRCFGGVLLAKLFERRGTVVTRKDLDDPWQNKDLPLVLGGWRYHLRKHGDEAVPVLIQALSECGTRDIAEGFVNSADDRLVQAGGKWAAKYGYVIKPLR